MATLDESEECRPLIENINNLSTNLYYQNIEPPTTYHIIQTLKLTVPGEENGIIPIFLIVGPKVRFIRFVRLISFFLIVLVFNIYAANSQSLLTTMVCKVFYKCSMRLLADQTDRGVAVFYLMPLLLSGLPLVLSLLFGFISDYTHYQRIYLISYSLVFASCSSFFLMLCSILLQPPACSCPQIAPTTQALIIFSVIFYIIGYAIFLPISLAYGLDLLEGTSWEVKYLYFPIYYVVVKLAQTLGVYSFTYSPESYLKDHCTAVFSIIFSILLLFIILRLFQIFPIFDTKPTGFKVISFRKGIEIFLNALKVRRSGQKSPRGHWFIQLSSDAHYGKYPRKQVQMVASLFEINFLFLFLMFLFTTSQTTLTLFPNQAFLLYPPISNITEICTDDETLTLTNLNFINFLTIVLCTPFIEYYFYKVIFFFNSPENLKNNRKSFLQKMKKCLRCFDRYWLVYDPILKRIFWGSIFGLISMVFALCVEIARINTSSSSLTCYNTSPTKVYAFSNLGIFTQTPQYISSGILEILSYIGILQFIYFQSNSTYQDDLKGLFFGLYYFYYGLASVISFTIYALMGFLCTTTGCGFCLIYVDDCPPSSFPYPLVLVPFVVLGFACLVVIAVFAWFAHYRHWQLSKIKEDFFVDEEG